MRRTRKDAEISKKTIIETAYKVFLEKGYSATKLSDIAKAMRMTRGVIYWHFKNKLDLFIYLLNETIDESFNATQNIFNSEATCSEKFKKLLYGNQFQSRLFDLLKTFHPVSNELDRKSCKTALQLIGKKVQAIFDSFTEFIEKEQVQGRLLHDMDARTFTATFLMFTSIVHAPNVSSGTIPLIAKGNSNHKAFADILWNGLSSVFADHNQHLQSPSPSTDGRQQPTEAPSRYTEDSNPPRKRTPWSLHLKSRTDHHVTC